MNKTLLISGLFLLFTLCTFTHIQAQEEEAEEPKQGWDIGAGIGLDLAQLLQINPRVGAGQNRLGLGGAITAYGKYNKNRFRWINTGSWQFGVQKIGVGAIPGTSDKIPFQKAIDELRLNSNAGYKTSENSKWLYTADFAFLSQVTPSYNGTDQIAGPLLRDVPGLGSIAKFFSPATINFSLGMTYKPNEVLSLYLSPAAYKGIIVLDDAIAALNVHGNEEGKNAFHNFGALFRAIYINKFADDKLLYSSNLSLYSNYLMEPDHIDVDWQNQIDYMILKNLSISLMLNVLYDHDILVQITDLDAPNGISGQGRRVNLTQQLLVKYTRQF